VIAPTLSIEPLTKAHDVASFESSSADLNEFLKRYARQNEKKGGSRTYVAVEGGKLAGFYSLAAGNILHETAAHGLKAGLAKTPIPTLLLARLAVDKSFENKGLGARLLKDALLRALSVARTVGVRAVVVHAKDERARAFYEHFGFESLPNNPLHLFLLTKDIEEQP
jgi:GNAT superfamily N-acetyltransferase